MDLIRGNFIMYDLSSEMSEFYEDHVRVKQSVYDDLRDKKEKNITRLESGLDDYNEENETSYSILEVREQGSVAMATIVQNDDKDYDIDVGIIFDEGNIGKNTGSQTAKNIVYGALEDKMGTFNEGPEYKTNCIRIKYSEGYHIDFAIYKKRGSDYWHAGAEWNKRNPRAINDWFNDQLQKKGEKLRKVIRLSKMFCKSRQSWDMPAGLIQTVLCNECFVNKERLDECLYETMRSIAFRLSYNKEVSNPTDVSMSLLTRKKDRDRLENFRKRLNDKLQNFSNLKSKKETIAAWHKFFNHDFWVQASNSLCESVVAHSDMACFSNTLRTPGEEFIEDYFEKDLRYDVDIDSIVRANGFMDHSIVDFLRLRRWLPHDKTLIFVARTNTPKPYEIKWKVRNVGEEAERRQMLRGQIIDCDRGSYNQRTEHSNFYGPHYVECYVIKDGKCVAEARANVPISR